MPGRRGQLVYRARNLAFPGTAGRHCEQVPRRVSGRQVGDVLRSCGGGQLRKPQLALEAALSRIADLIDKNAVPGRPGFRTRLQQAVLHRQRLSRIQERVDPGRVGVEHVARLRAANVVISFRGPFEPTTAHKPVGLETAGPRILRPPPQTSHPVVIHLEQPVLSSREPLCKKQVVQIPGLDMRDAPGVSIYIDRTAQAVEGHSGPYVRQCSGEVFVGNCVGHEIKAPIAGHLADVTLPTRTYRFHKTADPGRG